MFCNHCGSEVKDDAVFCSNCGKQLLTDSEADVLADEKTADAEVEPQAEVQQDGEGSSQFAQVQFDKPVKKSKKPFVLAIAAVAVALLVLFGVSNLGTVQGFFVKSFGSDADYLKFVEKKAFNTYTDDISNSYGKLFEQEDKAASKTEFKLNASDKAISMAESFLEDELDVDMDLDWINTISVNMDAVQKEKLSQLIASVCVDDKEIVSLDFINDADKQEIFVALLGLSDKYLTASTDSGDVGVSANYLTTALYTDPELKKALPSDEEIDNLLDKYIKIAIDNLDDVSKETDTIEVDGIEQKVTVLELEIDMDVVVEIAEDILKEVKNDKELEEYINDIADYLEKNDLVDDAGDAYDEFVDLIDDGLDELEDLDYDNETIINLVDYVNSKHEIVGRKLEVFDEEIISCVVARKGKKFAAEIEMPSVKIQGSGTEKNDVINGEFSLKVEGKKILEATVKDLSYNADNYALLNGNIRIYPSSKLFSELGIDTTEIAVLSIADLGIELDFESNKNSGKLDINIINSDEMFVGVSLSSEKKKATKIKVPDKDDVIDSEDIQEWIETFDTDDIISALEKSDIPEDFVEIFESLLSQSYYDDYDDYYADDYYADDYDDYYADDYDDYYADDYDDYDDYYDDYDDYYDYY